MKIKKIIKPLLTGFFGAMLLSSTVLAESYYWVSGNSMYPTLQDGNLIKVYNEKIENGDLVLAKINNGETVVKRLEGDLLVGDNSNSLSIPKKQTEIIGKVKKEDNINNGLNTTKQAKALENMSPIKHAYAGREYVLFLHEDTSVTGFGSNNGNILGLNGGETNSTGKLVKIADVTGFEKIVTGANSAFGLRPHDTQEGLYHLTRINQNIQTNPYTVSDLVKDFDTRGTTDSNPHQSSAYIDENGFLRVKGSEYGVLGIGYNYPYARYPRGGYTTFIIDNSLHDWFKALTPNGEPIIYPTSGTGYFLSNTDNSATGVSIISPAFEIFRDKFTIETSLHSLAPHPTLDRNVHYDDTSIINFRIEVYDGNLTDSEINSGSFAPLKTFSNPHSSIDRYTRNVVAELDLEGLSSKTYKIKISSQYVGWDMRIRDRIFLENSERILYRGNSSSRYTVIDKNHNVYINNGNRVIVPVTFNLEADVDIRPETAKSGGDSSHYGVLDTLGRLWTWSGTTANLSSFADIGTDPFYDLYEIIDFSVGNGFTMAVSKHKNTNETNVWVWGSNSHGKLGLNVNDTSVSTPTMIMQPDGNPMTNIQTIAAGQHMSVIVQNTLDGQLVWTAGKNNQGQLGGGVNLIVRSPQLVPGSNDTDRIYNALDELLIFNDTEKIVNSIGRGTSYVKPATLHPSINYYPTYFNVNEYKINTPMYTHAVYMSEEGNGHQTYTYNGQYYNGSIATLQIDEGDRYRVDSYDSEGSPIVTTEFLDFKPLNNGSRELKNIRKSAHTRWGTVILDTNGRLWTNAHNSWTYYVYTSGHGDAYNSVGEKNPRGYPGRGIGRYPNLRPIRYNFDTIVEDVKFVDVAIPTKIQTGNVYTVAITEERNLYRLTNYAYTWDVPMVNGKADKLFSNFNSVALLTTDDEVYVWGNNGSYRLGTGNNSSYSTPQLIPASYFNNEKIIDISGNDYLTMFLSEVGNVYVSGTNYYGMFGDSTILEGTSYSRPELIPELSKIGLTKIELGETFAAGIDNEKRVWAWGYAANGSLGNGFTMNRETVGTAFGNMTPDLIIENPVKSYYLSPTGNQNFTLKGKITEHDQETVNITATLLGVEKNAEKLSDSWTTDIYNEVDAQNWEINWHVDEFNPELNYQSLTKVVALDERGGIKEQFFASEIIVDGEIPQVPTWGQMCLLDENGLETNCSSAPMFETGGTNGVNQAIRIYLGIEQKEGLGKAPVYPQISFRKKTTGGFYLNDWSEWTEVKTKNELGYYIDIFQGFQGEAQFKLRTKDKAGNISSEQSESRYTIIANAGAEVDKVIISPKLENNIVFNELKFTAQTVTGSALVSYDIKRWLVGDYNEIETEEGDIIFEEKWQDLFETRQTWEGEEITFLDNSPDLFGNAEYEYHVDAENTVAIGRPMFEKVFTMPYEPENFSRAPRNDGLGLSLTQDKRNKGEILYRLVLVDNMTGDIYSEDRISSNRNEDIIFDLNDSEVPIQIVNNSIQIKLIVRGGNGLFHTIVYDEDFINSPAIANDDEAPNVQVSLEGNTTIQNTGENLINLNLFATDNFSPTNVLQVQFSSDGSRWFGFDTTTSIWRENNWSKYSTKFSGYPMGFQTGNRVVYVRVRDEAGNIGYGNTSLRIVDPIERGDVINIIDDEFAIVSPEEPYMHVNKNRRELVIPKPINGNISEVQFSFNGVVWSDWEVIPEGGLRKIFTLQGEDGYKTVFTRYRNEFGATTTVTETDIREYAFDTEAPTANIQTEHFSLVVRENSVKLLITATDNLSDIIGMKLIGPTGLSTTPIDFYAGVDLQKDSEYEVPISGLLEGPNNLRFEFTDKAGNVGIEEIRIIYRQ